MHFSTTTKKGQQRISSHIVSFAGAMIWGHWRAFGSMVRLPKNCLKMVKNGLKNSNFTGAYKDFYSSVPRLFWSHWNQSKVFLFWQKVKFSILGCFPRKSCNFYKLRYHVAKETAYIFSLPPTIDASLQTAIKDATSFPYLLSFIYCPES